MVDCQQHTLEHPSAVTAERDQNKKVKKKKKTSQRP